MCSCLLAVTKGNARATLFVAFIYLHNLCVYMFVAIESKSEEPPCFNIESFDIHVGVRGNLLAHFTEYTLQGRVRVSKLS